MRLIPIVLIACLLAPFTLTLILSGGHICVADEGVPACVRNWLSALAGPLAFAAVLAAWMQAVENRRASAVAVRAALALRIGAVQNVVQSLNNFDWLLRARLWLTEETRLRNNEAFPTLFKFIVRNDLEPLDQEMEHLIQTLNDFAHWPETDMDRRLKAAILTSAFGSARARITALRSMTAVGDSADAQPVVASLVDALHEAQAQAREMAAELEQENHALRRRLAQTDRDVR